MKIPAVDYCIVCEDVRIEINNKGILLGFFGVSPNAELLGQRKKQPLRIAFLVSFSRGTEGKTVLNGFVLDPDGNELAKSKDVSMKFEERFRHNVTFRISPFTPPKSGVYTFMVREKASEVYRTTFYIEFPNTEDK